MNELDKLVDAKVKEAMSQGSGRIVKRGHNCELPGKDFPAKTVWECNCGRRYKLSDPPFPCWSSTLSSRLAPLGILSLGRLVIVLIASILMTVAFGPLALALTVSTDWLAAYLLYVSVGFVTFMLSDL